MDSSLSGLATILTLNTRLFANCLDGVSAALLRRCAGLPAMAYT